MSAAANNNEDLELEEGEIAEDSNDGGSLTNDDNDNDQVDDLDGIRDAGGGGASLMAGSGTLGVGVPQKKRKKVVRKVRRKIKVKKKVVRKKTQNNNNNQFQPTSAGNTTTNQPQVQTIQQLQPQPQAQPTKLQSQPQHQPQIQPQVQHQHQHQAQAQLQTQLQLQLQPQLQPQPQNNQIDSLWEQQILMFEELQKQHQQAQILRAAATDEDLRIFAPNVVASTPSSPDDDTNEKSSYEAISKMLTLLRSSANVSDSSENFDSDQADSNKTTKTKGSIEYTLIPILVEGIDYTKYKLLSQYEPKFKNDPRLNQQT